MTNAETGPALDAAVLDSLRQLNQPGEPDVLKEVLRLFLADAPARLEAIANALEAGDAHALQRCAHALKGASGTIGALRLQGACRALEDVSRAGALDASSPLVAAVHTEYGRVKEEISALMLA